MDDNDNGENNRDYHYGGSGSGGSRGSREVVLEEFEEYDDEIENLAHGNVHKSASSKIGNKKGHKVSLVRSSAESGDWSIR